MTFSRLFRPPRRTHKVPFRLGGVSLKEYLLNLLSFKVLITARFSRASSSQNVVLEAKLHVLCCLDEWELLRIKDSGFEIAHFHNVPQAMGTKLDNIVF
jgi:hypothetical protein